MDLLIKQFSFSKENKINFVGSIKNLLEEVSTVMVCVKPQDMQKALTKNSNSITKDHLVLSIAAGTQLNKIQSVLYSFSCLKNV